jgi:uncharacterized protein
MNPSALAPSCVLIGIAAFGVAACSAFKPSGVNPRSFVLTALPVPTEQPAPSSTRAIGVGFVKVPEYLLARSIAIRRDTNEVVYLETARWAERLDRGLQRVLAANLTTLLPAVQVRLSAWRPEEVSAEVYVVVEQFDVDIRGECVLKTSWRIMTPGGGEVRKPPANSAPPARVRPPTLDPGAATAVMSTLVADLSRALADGLEIGPASANR